jgi:hypothetical protein
MNISADILIGRLSRAARDVLLSMGYNDVVPATGNVVVNLRRLDIARWSEDGELRLTERGRDVKGTLHAQREQREATVTVNTAQAKAEPFRPAYKTVTKVEVSYVLQSSTDGELWSYVSDHTTEQDATLRAQGLLSRGCGLKFRVAEHRSEIRATGIIEAPSEKPEAAYWVDEDTRDGYAVYETAIDRCVYRSMSRYGAQTVCDGLNSGEMVLRDGTVVQA